MDIDEALKIINAFGKAVEVASAVSRKKLSKAKRKYDRSNKGVEASKELFDVLQNSRKYNHSFLPFSKEKIREASQILIKSGEFSKEEVAVDVLLDDFE